MRLWSLRMIARSWRKRVALTTLSQSPGCQQQRIAWKKYSSKIWCIVLTTIRYPNLTRPVRSRCPCSWKWPRRSKHPRWHLSDLRGESSPNASRSPHNSSRRHVPPSQRMLTSFSRPIGKAFLQDYSMRAVFRIALCSQIITKRRCFSHRSALIKPVRTVWPSTVTSKLDRLSSSSKINKKSRNSVVTTNHKRRAWMKIQCAIGSSSKSKLADIKASCPN